MVLQMMWPSLVQRHGGKLAEGFDLSTLTHVSEGYSSGTIDQVCRPASLSCPCTELAPHTHTHCNKLHAWLLCIAARQPAPARLVKVVCCMFESSACAAHHAIYTAQVHAANLASCRWCAAC